MKLCQIDGCERKHAARGWCHTHYELNRRTGSPIVANPTADNSGPCSVEGCGQPAKCQALCDKHYTRTRRHGDTATTYSNRDIPAIERFWMKVDKAGPWSLYRHVPGQCWIWNASSGGKMEHGLFVPVKGKPRVAHRWLWEQLRGPVDPILDLDHLCRVPRCVNPDHLEPVSHRENCLRGTSPAAKNFAKTHCKYGHEFTEENTYRTATGSRNCRECARRYQQKLRGVPRRTRQPAGLPVRTEQLSLAWSAQASVA